MKVQGCLICETPRLFRIQACILLGAISTTEGDAITESVYYTISCRMANLLDLSNREVPNAIDHEIDVRSKFHPLCFQ